MSNELSYWAGPVEVASLKAQIVKLTAENERLKQERIDDEDHLNHADAYQKAAMDNLAEVDSLEEELAEAKLEIDRMKALYLKFKVLWLSKEQKIAARRKEVESIAQRVEEIGLYQLQSGMKRDLYELADRIRALIAVDIKLPSGRSIWEVANQLGGYVGPTTEKDLAEFLLRESDAAAELADMIVSLREELNKGK